MNCFKITRFALWKYACVCLVTEFKNCCNQELLLITIYSFNVARRVSGHETGGGGVEQMQNGDYAPA